MLLPKDEVEDGIAPELAKGFKPAPYTELSAEERARFLFDSREHGHADREEMLKELTVRDLHRKEGMPDYVFVQQLATKVRDHITYHAGNDLALNHGKPPSHAFKSGWGQCGRFSAVM